MITMGKKLSAQGGTASPKHTPAATKLAADAPLFLTLRDVEVPLPPTPPSTLADDGLVLSDTELQPEPYLGDPDADREAQRAARRAQVRKDRLRDATPQASPAPASIAAETVTPSAPPIPAAPAAPSVAAPPVVSAVLTQCATSQASAGPPASAASPESVKPTRPVVDAPHAGPAAPAILVLRAPGNDPDPLCEQLKAFGFDVQVRQDPPDLPAPWPFVAMFVDQALQPADGGNAMDLCNDVRERSRLPGVLKPVLVLVADQLSATNRVRAGLAGCNEILLGEITRGSVARVLDTRGIALPSDARRA